jgi:hypothetical protein
MKNFTVLSLKHSWLMLMLCLFFNISYGPIYVNASAPGPTHDGSSLDNAYLNLQDAFYDATGTGSIDAFSLGDIEVELTLNPCSSLIMAVGDLIQPQCFGGDDGHISVVVTGGNSPYNFSWEGSASTDSVRTDLDAGTYTISVEDNIGCLESLTVILGQPSQVTITLDNIDNETCPGAANGSIEVTATGGTGSKSFSWSNGGVSGLNENLTAGFYSVTATDDNGCTAEETYEVQTNNQNPVVTCPSPDTISICLGVVIDLDTLFFSPSGGVFSINGFVNGSIFNSSAENTGFNHIWYLYTDQITGCMDSCLFVINVEENLQVDASSNSPVCEGQLIQLNATGSGGTPGYTYQWAGPDNFSSNLSNPQIVAASGVTFGTYNVTVTDANGCTDTDFVEVVEQVIDCFLNILMYMPNGDRVFYSDFLMALDELPASDGTPNSGGLLRVTDPDTGEVTYYIKDETDTLYELTLSEGSVGTSGPSGLWIPSIYNPGM